MRIAKFGRCLRALSHARLLSRRNIRAAWRQSGPEPLRGTVAFLDLTDEEWERYMESFE